MMKLMEGKQESAKCLSPSHSDDQSIVQRLPFSSRILLVLVGVQKSLTPDSFKYKRLHGIMIVASCSCIGCQVLSSLTSSSLLFSFVSFMNFFIVISAPAVESFS